MIISKSRFAFQCNLDTIFSGQKYGYLWTFTFADMPEIEDAAQRWRHLVNWLVRYYEGTVFGVRVYELHKTHGIHIHAVINRRLDVNGIRPMAQHYGFGRIHVKRVTREGAGYTAKYLTKQDRTAWLKHKRLWTTFGNFQNTKITDIVVESNFTRAVKFCQDYLQKSKLPFWLVNALQKHPTDDTNLLSLVCKSVKCGPYYADVIRLLRP